MPGDGGVLRQFNLLSVAFRLLLAILFGGMLGIERARKGRAAGFRTYMFVCLGAALSMLLSQYDAAMLAGPWAETAQAVDAHTDVARIGALVISGIGFLGAGTILVTGRQEVKGLTTAAGLWASACMGLAIGAGFYECVVLGFILIFLCIGFLPQIDTIIVSHSRNMNIYVEFTSLDDVGTIIGKIKEQGAHIYDVDIIRETTASMLHPAAVFSIRINEPRSHGRMIMAIYELERVITIDEV